MSVMTKLQAQTTIQNLSSELFSLNASALLTFYEINLEELGFNLNVISQSEIDQGTNTIFRFHNSINLTSNSIFWQGNEYIAAPIQGEGFELSVRGSPTTPKLSLSVSDAGIPHLSRLKDRLFQMGDIVGAKVTRIRTYARFIDAINFAGGIPPANYYPDPNAELPRDIFYIDRKSAENKNFIEYELAPIFETENIKLPGRLVTVDSCTAQYRGEGCLYEYNSRRTFVHKSGILPQYAPPMANAFDENINSIITGVAFTDKGLYNNNQVYNKGDFIYITHRGINYYFVSKIDSNQNFPPEPGSWMADLCSKRVRGCRIRWANISSGNLPLNAFVSCNKFS